MNFLKYINGLTSISINGAPNLKDLSALTRFSTLNSVTINNAKSFSNLDFCSGLTSLQTLNVNGCSVSNLHPLKNVTSLQSLDLRNNPVGDSAVDKDDGKSKSNLAVLANLNKIGALRKLYLGGEGTSITDYTILNDGTRWDEKVGW